MKKGATQKGQTIITVENLSKSFFGLQALNKINLSFKRGHFYALLGHNGAGKSTLLRCIAGIQHYHEGQVRIFGKDIQTSSATIHDKVGLVHENINYNLSVNLEKFFNHYSSYYSSWDKNLFRDLMKRQNIDLGREFHTYSRGQKMQIALIANLAKCPEVLLIDEITSVLDVYSQKFFIQYLREFVKNGKTVIMTTNIINEVDHQVDHTVLLRGGEIIYNGPRKSISRGLIKLRQTKGDRSAIFKDPHCFWVGTNSDYSTSYILPKSDADNYKGYEKHLDRREISLNEFFLYQTGFEMDR